MTRGTAVSRRSFCFKVSSFFAWYRLLYGSDILLMIGLDTLRVYRPRVLVHGEPGMGQGYLGSAALHHLEGFHVQSLDLGTLMSDSTRVSCFKGDLGGSSLADT